MKTCTDERNILMKTCRVSKRVLMKTCTVVWKTVRYQLKLLEFPRWSILTERTNRSQSPPAHPYFCAGVSGSAVQCGVVQCQNSQRRKQSPRAPPTPTEYVFVPTQHWRHSFLKRYDPKLCDIKKKTSYNLDAYLAQAGPALANTFAMRSLYEVEGCKGLISNVDQAMHYRWYGGDRAYKLRR